MMALLGHLMSLSLFQLITTIYQTGASEPVDLTQGFTSLPLNQSNILIQRPYDVSEEQRHSFINGVHKLWVYSTDKPHIPTSKTAPRTEIRMHVSILESFTLLKDSYQNTNGRSSRQKCDINRAGVYWPMGVYGTRYFGDFQNTSVQLKFRVFLYICDDVT